MEIVSKIFSIRTEEEFNDLALEVFHYQYDNNLVYHTYVDALKVDPAGVNRVNEIPFLPVEFFKTQRVACSHQPPQKVFRSSGTTGAERSAHPVNDLTLYRRSLEKGFEFAYGPVDRYQFLSLTPTPEQNPDSSLVFMIQRLMDLSQSAESGYFLTGFSGLQARLNQARTGGRTIFLIGLTYELLDFIDQCPGHYAPLIVMETGGMKGKREEITREALHAALCLGFGIEKVHSEYGMTELLSQAYSKGDGLFTSPPWMKILIRDPNDPLSHQLPVRTGGINIVDLANLNSCSFIATQDLGRMHPDGRFEVLGRFDASDSRGCSLMIG
jgi:hypothetical protein